MTEIKEKCQIYTDSLFMINKLNWIDKYPSSPLKITLHAEWDVLSALHKTLKWFPTKQNSKYVYIHQDDTPDTKQLSILVQFNIETDELETQVLIFIEPKPHVPFYQASKIKLDVNAYTITRNIKHTL